MTKRILLLALLGLMGITSSAQLKRGSNPTIVQSGQLLQLEKAADRAGLKIAEVALTGNNDVTTIKLPASAATAQGTLIWNTATVSGLNDVSPGFYVWSGTLWDKVVTGSSINKNIYDLDGTVSSNRIVEQGTNTLAFTPSPSSGTGHFTVDGATLAVDALNNRVGIGTFSPAAPLDVSGNVFVSGTMAVGTTSPSTSAALELSSGGRGFLPPRMTSSQRNSISSPANGMFVYQTDVSKGLYHYNNFTWERLSFAPMKAAFFKMSSNSSPGLGSYISGWPFSPGVGDGITSDGQRFTIPLGESYMVTVSLVGISQTYCTVTAIDLGSGQAISPDLGMKSYGANASMTFVVPENNSTQRQIVLQMSSVNGPNPTFLSYHCHVVFCQIK